MSVVQELLQKVTVEEAVRRGVRIALPPRSDGGPMLGVRRVRDFGHDLAQVAVERRQVERELWTHVGDDANAPGRREEV